MKRYEHIQISYGIRAASLVFAILILSSFLLNRGGDWVPIREVLGSENGRAAYIKEETMSKHQTEFLSNLSPDDLLAACERAASTLGWPVTKKHATGLTCKQTARMPMEIGNPVTLEVNLGPTPGGDTKITLKGKSFGFGPIQSNYVTQRVQEFSAAFKRAAGQHVPSDPATTGSRSVLFNGVFLPDEHINALEGRYRTHIPNGAYWYDAACGAWGVRGGPALGLIQSGLGIGGPLQPDASNGDTGVFVNRRQLHRLDVLGLQQLLGPVLPGRYWLDAMGNYGFEGGMMIGNLVSQAQQRRGSVSGVWGGVTYGPNGMVSPVGAQFKDHHGEVQTYFP